MNARTPDPADHLIEKEPYYETVGDEIQLFEAAYRQQIPVLLKGPTGCGKTRFMEHMAWRLKRPLITVSCHDDLTASDLVGRYLIKGGETVWVDGPLTRAVRCGGICYLDEIVEARKDTMVVIHPLADDRRPLPMEKLGQMVEAPPEFCLAISYNPGYQSVLKDLKQSTRQRFVALEFDYPSATLERRIVTSESGVSDAIADNLVRFAQMTRNLKGSGLEEGASTRLLVHAGKLIADGVSPVTACKSAVAQAVTDDTDMLKAIQELSSSIFWWLPDGTIAAHRRRDGSQPAQLAGHRVHLLQGRGTCRRTRRTGPQRAGFHPRLDPPHRLHPYHAGLAIRPSRSGPAAAHGAAPAGSLGRTHLRRVRPYRPANGAQGHGRSRQLR